MLHVVTPQQKELPNGNFFDLYFEFMRGKEPPQIFNRWCAITAIGAWLGRKYWLPFGESRIFPNTYCMLIGDPGTRKSTAIKHSKKVLSVADYKSFAADKTSKEKFLLDLEGADEEEERSSGAVMDNLFGNDYAPTEPKEVFIVADEFNEFAGNGNIEFLSLLGNLWDYDDETGPYEYRLKNSKSVAIYQPTVSLLSGNTHAGFAEAFPPAAIGQGFLSRLILIFSEESGRKETIPKAAPEALRAAIVQTFHLIRDRVVGPATIEKQAMGMLDVIYRQPSGIDDVRFKHYSTRRFTHLLKLCLICSATRFATQITPGDVLLANSILAYAEHFMPRALGEFGMARTNPVANRILALLTESKSVISESVLWRQVSSDLDRPEDLMKILEGLRQAGKIQWVPKSGNNTGGFLIVRKLLNAQRIYVDFNLLKETTA